MISDNRTVSALALTLAMVALAAPVQADPVATNDRDFELQLNMSFGGAPFLGLGVDGYNEGISTALVTEKLAVRLRLPRHTPLGLEISGTFGFSDPVSGGFGINLLIDVYRNDWVRIHLLDPGFLFSAPGHFPAVSRISRAFDLTIGLGIEVFLENHVCLTADWRMSLPDPINLATTYGNFYLPILDEAAKGGQLWLGISAVW